MSRPSKDDYLMNLALLAARRTTCLRRGTGCVLADKDGRVLSIGYNGVAATLSHCNEAYVKGPSGFAHPVTAGRTRAKGALLEYPHACAGWDLPPGQDKCEAVHAEQNALVQCPDALRIDTAYVTLEPCPGCAKLLLNTPCWRIIFHEEHCGTTGRELWEGRACRTWTKWSGAELVALAPCYPKQ